MKHKVSKYGIGHKVSISGDYGMAAQGSHYDVITDVDIRYDQLTGEPFHIYKVGDRWWTENDGVGGDYSNPHYMYDVYYDIPQDTKIDGLDERENEMKQILFSDEYDNNDKVEFLKDMFR